MSRLRMLALFAALAAPAGAALAQAPADGAAPAAAAADAEAPKPVVEEFQASADLEPMRYRHLWIAYSAIWFLVFFFMFRTWKNSEKTHAELEVLKRRLAELEGRDGG